jgi:serine/threonine protein kinase/outer membrane protein assembly factor BamB
MGEGLAALAAGVRVGGYLLEEQVGAGGMAVVFRARDERLRRLVALKVLGPGLAADEDFRQRFIRESRAAAAVEDPHIIPVHEAGQADGVLFIAMRYVSGGDVRTLLRRAGPLSPDRAAAIISPVAAALDSAHAAGLVHRDVKPANMLLDARPGRPEHVYLSDFGLSKGTLSVGLTGTGHFLGTPGYSAPEQIQGRPVDGRADQYALACTAFELLCGTAVFQRDEVLAMMYAHLSEPPPPLASRRPGTPAAADAVLARALAKDPAGRYASCQEFADALRGAFRLAAYHAAYEPSPPPDHRLPAITHGNGLAATRNGLPADPMTQSAGLRDPRHPATPGHPEEVTGSWPETQHRARHARAQNDQAHPVPPSQNQGREPEAARGTEGPQGAARKPAVTRRTILGLTAAAATAGLAAAAWDLTRHTTPPRHTPTRPAGTQPGGTPIWTTLLTNSAPPVVQAVVDGIVYVANGDKQFALRVSDGAKLSILGSLAFLNSLGKGIVCAEGDDGLYAVRAADGHKLWYCEIQDLNATTVDGSIIYAATEHGEVYAVSARTGHKIWSFPTNQGQPSGLAAASGVAYIGGTNPGSSIYAIRAGLEVWRVPLASYLDEPVIVGDHLYVSSGKLRALDTSNGAEVWSFPSDSVIFEAYSDVVYVTDGNWTVYALSADDGRKLWQFHGGPTTVQVPSVTRYGDTVYIESDVAVFALRAKDGTLLWRFDTTEGSIPGVASGNGTVYVADNDLYALRAADGKELWRFPVEVSAVTIANGAAYFGSTNWRVYAVRT